MLLADNVLMDHRTSKIIIFHLKERLILGQIVQVERFSRYSRILNNKINNEELKKDA